MAKKFPGAGQFDSSNSTYKHKIHLTNGKELTGYSKGMYVSEPSDKIVLLERVIHRLTNNGYLNPDRVVRIEFYYNKFLQGNDEKIITLYPAGYELEATDVATDFRFAGFIKSFYNALRTGNITKSLTHKPVISTEESDLNWRVKRFTNQEKLHEYIIKLIDKGYSSEAVKDYYRKYKDTHL